MIRLIGLTKLLIFASPALARHSDAGLDMNTVVSVEGVVTDFRWRNPHVYITIDTTDGQGDESEWKLQAAAISVMSRMG